MVIVIRSDHPWLNTIDNEHCKMRSLPPDLPGAITDATVAEDVAIFNEITISLI